MCPHSGVSQRHPHKVLMLASHQLRPHLQRPSELGGRERHPLGHNHLRRLHHFHRVHAHDHRHLPGSEGEVGQGCDPREPLHQSPDCRGHLSLWNNSNGRPSHVFPDCGFPPLFLSGGLCLDATGRLPDLSDAGQSVRRVFRFEVEEEFLHRLSSSLGNSGWFYGHRLGTGACLP